MSRDATRWAVCLALLVTAVGLAAAGPVDGETLDDPLAEDGDEELGANVSFVLRGAETPEDGGVAAVEVRVSNDSNFVTVEVTHNVTGGTAGQGADYEGGDGTLTFDEPGQVRTVNLTLADDGDQEADETVELTLSSDDTLVTFGTRNHTHTLADDDPANLAPTTPDASVTLEAGTTWSGTLPGSDPDGDLLTWSVGVPPDHGSLDLDSTGAFTYAPDAGFVGNDGFSYQVTDGTDAATGHVDVTVEPADDGSGGGNGVGGDDGAGDGTQAGTGDDGTGDGSGDGTATTNATSGTSDGSSAPGADGGDGSQAETEGSTAGEGGGIGLGWWILGSVVAVISFGAAITYGLYRSQYGRF